MKLGTPALFAIPTLIWGSTWYAITLQLGSVPVLWSVGYRFVMAGVLLFAFCLVTGKSLRFSRQDHLRILLQGVFLFGLNYWFTYLAEERLPSALVAVAFSMLIFINMILGRLFLSRKAEPKVFVGACLGILGTFAIFYNELKDLSGSDLPVFALVVCLLSILFASTGNIISSANQTRSIPILQSNAFGMLYGGLLMMLIALLTGQPIAFTWNFTYVGSLVYLSIFGSIIAFNTYLTLIGRIGPSKAAYVLVAIPVVSIFISGLLEGFVIGLGTVIGMGLILGGNLIVLKK